MSWWYWRAHDATRSMTIGHGSANTRQGMVEQIAAMLLHSPHIASVEGRGIELIIEPPRERVPRVQT